MREECAIYGCGKPAVDYFERRTEDGEYVRLYLCAEHWDKELRARVESPDCI